MLLHSLQTFMARPTSCRSCACCRAYAGDPPPWIFQCDVDRLMIAPGGRTRTESVRNGLEDLPDEASVVLVHDAARPLVGDATIDRVVERGARRARRDRRAAGRRHAQGSRRRRTHRAHGRARATVARADAAGFSARGDRARASRARRRSGSARPTTPRCASDSAFRCVVVRGSERAMKITDETDFARAEALFTVR